MIASRYSTSARAKMERKGEVGYMSNNVSVFVCIVLVYKCLVLFWLLLFLGYVTYVIELIKDITNIPGYNDWGVIILGSHYFA